MLKIGEMRYGRNRPGFRDRLNTLRGIFVYVNKGEVDITQDLMTVVRIFKILQGSNDDD